MEGEPRGEVIACRVTLSERRLLEALAARRGQPVLGAFVREHLLEQVKEEFGFGPAKLAEQRVGRRTE